MSRSARRRDERGAVAIITVLAALAMLVVTAMVIDFGSVRWDRQTNKLAADDAAAAGLQAADQGTGDVYDSTAVCAAVAYLKANRPALTGLPSCTASSSQTCQPGVPASYAAYHATTTSGGRTYEVWVKSPYSVTDTSTGGAWPSESLATQVNDTGDPAQQGCDQIGVVIKQTSTPGIGKIVYGGDLVTRIRSVGRVKIQNSDQAPALLLLDRTHCGVLTVGSAGSPSRIQVAANGTTPATVHADSSATDAGCGSGPNQQLLQGKQAGGVVAYGTGTISGSITTYATQLGRAADVVTDSDSNVYGTTGVYGGAAGTTSTVTGRKQVTRRPVDNRYLDGVKLATADAWSKWRLDHSSPTGFTRVVNCNPNMTAMATLTASDSLYVDCDSNSGITLNGTIGAGTIYFHGFVKNGNLKMPNATKVYIDNTTNSGSSIGAQALSLTSTGSGFCVRSSFCDSLGVGTCPSATSAGSATLLVRQGSLATSGGLVRLCNTRVILEGGDIGSGNSSSPGGCLPGGAGTPPTSTPCATSPSTGDGVVSLSGTTDWTAPNAYGDMSALTTTQKQAAWAAGEDLALWTESYGSGSTYKMAGGGNMHVGGVFFVGNAAPFTVTGNGLQDLTNAQFISTSFAVDGGATLKMQVDANNAVPLPTLYDFRLVR